jgi:hypothetical protein
MNSRAAIDTRKQAVSVRMSRSDVRHIKRLAERLGARDSDIIRFAIKLMLARLAPLEDPAAGGRGLLPVLLDYAPDLMRHFELDTARLTGIINDGVEEGHRVEAEDVRLIAMNGQRPYAPLNMLALRRARAHGHGAAPPVTGHDQGSTPGNTPGNTTEGESLDGSLLRYLYDKYLLHDKHLNGKHVAQGGA